MSQSSIAIVPSTDVMTRYERDGVALIEQIVPASWLDVLRVEAGQALAKSDNYFRRHTLWPEQPRLRAFCGLEFTAGLAAAMMGSEQICLLYDQAFVKAPRSATATPWHNDQPYWPVRGWQVMTLWVALDTISLDTGPMEFVGGSHRWNRWFQPFLSAENGSADGDYERDVDFEALPDFDAQRGELNILRFDMRPGDALVFHGLTVHGALPNNSNKTRRGYAIRYTGDDARYHEGPSTNPRLRDETLNVGDRMDGEFFPRVWPPT